jgi:C-methyltransferase C-terminal domain
MRVLHRADRLGLRFVVNCNVRNQGRFMPGVHVPIDQPEPLLDEMPDYVLLFAWNFREEVMVQRAEYRARGGRFIVPWVKLAKQYGIPSLGGTYYFDLAGTISWENRLRVADPCVTQGSC